MHYLKNNARYDSIDYKVDEIYDKYFNKESLAKVNLSINYGIDFKSLINFYYRYNARIAEDIKNSTIFSENYSPYSDISLLLDDIFSIFEYLENKHPNYNNPYNFLVKIKNF